MPVPLPPDDPDPFGLVDTFLAIGAPGGDAERVYLAWLIGLDPALDPAPAAARLLRDRAGARAPTNPSHARLLALLAATARWPRAAVTSFHARRATRLELS